MLRLCELLLICAACLAPMFILASEVDGDEFVKAGSGAMSAAVIAGLGAAYKVWSEKRA